MSLELVAPEDVGVDRGRLDLFLAGPGSRSSRTAPERAGRCGAAW